MRLAIRRMAAPAAMIRAAAGGDHRDRAFAMMAAPDLEILFDRDALAVRPRLRVEIRNQFARAGADDGAIRAPRRDAVDARQIARAERRQQLLQRDLRFAF